MPNSDHTVQTPSLRQVSESVCAHIPPSRGRQSTAPTLWREALDTESRNEPVSTSCHSTPVVGRIEPQKQYSQNSVWCDSTLSESSYRIVGFPRKKKHVGIRSLEMRREPTSQSRKSALMERKSNDWIQPAELSQRDTRGSPFISLQGDIGEQSAGI